MKLNDLQSAGAFIDTSLVKKTAQWTRYSDEHNGEITTEVSFFVRRASYLEVKRASPGGGAELDGVDPDGIMLASCIRLGDDGKEVIPYADVLRLEPRLYRIFMEAINDVYGEASGDPKRSRTSKSSGASSSSAALAGAASSKRSKRSPTTKR